ncbi:MAG: TIGR01777 family oxidoreductase [Bacteroidota bacterium]
MKTIGITGGTGFVGQHLTKMLVAKGYEVLIFTRSVAVKSPAPHVNYVHWDSDKGECDNNALRSIDAIVHLAGAGIANKRWSADRKQKIVDSRVKVTDFLVAQLREHAKNCKVLVSASATGYYGADTNGKPFTEDDAPATDFLGDTCRQWEAATQKAEDALRTVILRFGIVLGKEDGAFAKFALPMSFGIMPVLGKGTQVVSWIEADDLAGLVLHAIEKDNVSGIYNAVAPQPVTHRELMQTIADTKGGIKIPVPVPAFMLKTLVGEMSEEVLKSCTVSANKILSTGFKFQRPDIKKAVKAILGKE